MIPTSRDQLVRYSPPSLKNLPAPPVFIFRASTWSIRRRYQEVCESNNLSYPHDVLVNAILKDSLRQLWTPESFERESARLEDALLKQEQGILAGEELTDFLKLLDAVAQVSEPFARVLAQRQSFLRYAPYAGLTLMLAGWENLDTPFERNLAFEVSFDTLEALEREILLIEEKAKADKVEGVTRMGVAWSSICNELWSHLNLNGDQRKNSSPESQSAGTPDGSTADGRATPDGEASETETALKSSASGPEAAPSLSRKTRAKAR